LAVAPIVQMTFCHTQCSRND